MRKSIPIALILIFLFNTGGYYLWYIMIQYNLRQEIRTEIKNNAFENELSLIIIQKNEPNKIHWIEKNEEFKLNEEMYDVVKIEQKHDKSYIYCLNDKQEKQLLNKFYKNQRSKQEAEKRLKRSFIQYCFSQNYFKVIDEQIAEFQYCKLVNHYKSRTSDILSPPPKFS